MNYPYKVPDDRTGSIDSSDSSAMPPEEKTGISYAIGLQTIADRLEDDAARVAVWLVGNYTGAPDWPMIAEQWSEQAAMCRALAALCEAAERAVQNGCGEKTVVTEIAIGFRRRPPRAADVR